MKSRLPLLGRARWEILFYSRGGGIFRRVRGFLAVLRSWYCRPEVAFALLVWLGSQFVFRYVAFEDPGALWHTKIGQRILADGFMRIDPFTFTFPDSVWIPQQWGGEVGMALAHRAGGFDTMLALMNAGVALLFTWIFSRAIRNGMHPLLAAMIVAGAALTCAFHFFARPHMATIAGMAIVMAAILDFERGRASAWRLWWLIPFFALWTNVHGGVLGGVFTLGLAVAGWGMIWLARRASEGSQQDKHNSEPMLSKPSLARRANGPIRSWRTAALLIAIVAACGLTAFVNPFGMEMIRTWKKIVGSSAMKELVSEHQPLSLDHTAGQVVVGLGIFYAIMLAGAWKKPLRVGWFLPLVWFALSVQSIRQGPLFAVLAAVAMADLWPETIWYELLKKHGDSLSREPETQPRSWRWLAIPAACLVIVLGLQFQGVSAPVVGRNWAGLNPESQPLELIEPLKDYASRVPAGTPIFNDANLGGFVIYHAPQLKIFMDDRFELYGDAWLREYADAVMEHPEKFDAWAETYGFERAILAVTPERMKLEEYLANSPKWVEVARCDRGVIFRKKTVAELASR